MSGHVVIVGGGLSGLAAGVGLASQGIRTTILEQKPSPGGRAYSFQDSVTGDTIDNGQHVLIAGYERTMHFLETIGTRQLLRVQETPSLTFHHPRRGFQTLRLSRLHIPFNFLVGVLRCTLFSIPDRLRLVRAGNALRSAAVRDRPRLERETVQEWLERAGQSDECIRSFWEPLAVSIMNEKTRKASAFVFVKALGNAFLGGPMSAALAVPSVGLTQLYVESARRYVTLHGGSLQCNADVVKLHMEGGVAEGVKLRDDTVVRADAVILTIPPHKLVSVIPPQLRESLPQLPLIGMSPIVSVHLWFQTDFMDQESVALIGRRIQWLFNRRLINREGGKGAHISAVISGAYDFVDLTKEELVRIAVEDIRSAYPVLSERPWHSVVIREKSATYSSSPATESMRPSTMTPLANVFLAGDWTATGYPATIEGAVLSAERAVECVRKYLPVH